MSEEYIGRINEGRALLKDHLASVEEEAKLFLAALKGFRRDLPLSVQACPDNFETEFPESAAMLDVPKLSNGMSFSDLRKMLALADQALDGIITVTDPLAGPETSVRDRLLKEIEIAHRNLAEISDTSRRLYESMQTAGFEFDVFNTNDLDANMIEADVLFDRDALNVSGAAARALGERAVRMDIDLVASKERLMSGRK